MYSCNKCNKEYSTSGGLSAHSSFCIEGIIYVCSLCPLTFKTKHQFQYHMPGTHGSGFSCSECSFKTKHKSNLSAHESSFHSGIVFPCQQCHFKASNNQTLKRHDKREHEGIVFRCTECSQVTSEKSKLNQHISRKHHKYDCTCLYCGRKNKGNKNEERKTEKSICCTCKKSFANNATLKRHVQSSH